MTSTVVVIADLHINSTVALCKPVINLDDGGTYHASKSQRWLWKCWLDLWTEKIKKTSGDKILVINGDLGELDTMRRSTQIISANKATIQLLVLDTIEPALAWADRVYIIRGTAAHTGKSSWLEEAIAADLDHAVPSPNSASWWHLRTVCEGVRFDIAHHASMGKLPQSEKNAANKLAFLAQYRYAVDMKQQPPDVVIRSHNHRYADSGNNFGTYALCTAAWTIATEYVYRIGQENTLADIGAHVFKCEDGKFTPEYISYDYPEVKKIWSMKM